MKSDTQIRALGCPKCGKKPVMKRSEDPAEIDKRYSVRCSDIENCKYKKVIYGPTKNAAIKFWNDKVCRVAVNHTESELRFINAGR